MWAEPEHYIISFINGWTIVSWIEWCECNMNKLFVGEVLDNIKTWLGRRFWCAAPQWLQSTSVQPVNGVQQTEATSELPPPRTLKSCEKNVINGHLASKYPLHNIVQIYLRPDHDADFMVGGIIFIWHPIKLMGCKIKWTTRCEGKIVWKREREQKRSCW